MRNTALLLAFFAVAAAGQSAAPAKSAPAASLFREEVTVNLNSVEARCLALAKAVPQDKLTWRPMDGVRSFGEVFVHMAGSTLLLGSYVGLKAPAGPAQELAGVYMKRGFEMPEIFASEAKIKESARIIAVMDQAFTAMRNHIREMPDSDLDKSVDFFGKPMTMRAVLILMPEHLGEHLGQAIAYARVNHIVPPWSEKK